MKQPWYNLLCGGKKVYQAILAAGLITLAYLKLPDVARETNFVYYCGAILLCLGIYSYGNLKEHLAANGKGTNANGNT